MLYVIYTSKLFRVKIVLRLLTWASLIGQFVHPVGGDGVKG